MPPCKTLHTSHTVFRSHGDHKKHGEKTRQRSLKNLCALSVPPCLRAKLFIPSHAVFRSHGSSQRIRRDEAGKSSEKPPGTLCLRAKLFTHPIPFSDLTKLTKDTERSRQSLEKPPCPPCLRAKLYPTPFSALTEFTRTRRKISQRSKKPPCPPCLRAKLLYIPSHFQISQSSQRTQRGANKALKTLRALCASVRNSLYIPYRFGSHGDHRGHGGGRKSVEKPLFETLPLTESTKAKERGQAKI